MARANNTRRRWISGSILLVAGLILMNLTSCRNAPPLRQGWSKTKGPVVPHDKFPGDCSLCHTGGNWTTIRKDFSFDHKARTGVELRGAHQDASCLMCHNDRGPVAIFAARGCAGCHDDPHRARHSQTCQECHQEQNWRPTGMIQAHERTRFPLVGAHASTMCISCHPGEPVGNFSGNDTACVACHQKDLQQTNAPNHIAQGWTGDCHTCHIPQSWQSARFRHTPAFPLTGGHAGVDCTKCHHGEVFLPLSTDCVNCHLSNYQNTKDPNHVELGFSTDCAMCHRPTAWRGGNPQRRK